MTLFEVWTMWAWLCGFIGVAIVACVIADELKGKKGRKKYERVRNQ